MVQRFYGIRGLSLVLARRFLLFPILTAAFFTTPVRAVTLHVPSEYPTIQAGIDAAAGGDTVLVAAGTYTGAGNRDVTIGGGVIVLGSGRDLTIVDCESEDRAFTMVLNSRLQSLTVRNGRVIGTEFPEMDLFPPDQSGASILITGSGVTVKDVAVRHGFTNYGGGGIHVADGQSVLIEDVVIENCTVQRNGGAISVSAGGARITGCVLRGNHANRLGGAIYCHKTYPGAGDLVEIDSCTLIDNTSWDHGAAVAVLEGSCEVAQCVVANHHRGAAAFWLWGDAIDVENSILFGNTHGNFGGGAVDQSSLNGNFAADPVFIDYFDGDYRPHASSPCLPENNGVGLLIGAESAGSSVPLVALSGSVTSGRDAMSGAHIVGGSYPCFADDTGAFSLFVEAGWSGTVAPWLPYDCGFSPPDYLFADLQSDQTGLDFSCDPGASEIQVPGYVPTLCEAIAHAQDGDTVVLASGSHSGVGFFDISTQSKAITVRGEDPEDKPTIDLAEAPWHHGFICRGSETDATMLKDIRIANAYDKYDGCGMSIDWGAAVSLSNVTFEECRTWGFVEDIMGTGATGAYGGGLGIRNGGYAHLSGCEFTNCSAHSGLGGGGIYVWNGAIDVVDATFTDNRTNRGGAVYLSNATATFTNSVFTDNTGQSYTNIYHGGGDVTPGKGGAVYSKNSTITIDRCDFRGNTTTTNSYGEGGSSSYGGAILIDDSTLQATDCLFDGNYAQSFNGYIYPVSSARGGAIYMAGQWQSCRVAGCTFYGNGAGLADDGEGGGTVYAAGVNLTLERSIICGTTRGGGLAVDGAEGTAITECNDVYGNTDGDYTRDCPDQTGLNGNISVDPWFCDSANDDYTLNAQSPCLPANNSCGVRMGAFGEGCAVDLLTISGAIRDLNGAPRSDVRLSGGPDFDVWSDEQGEFTVFVPAGWSGTLTPEFEHIVFAPAEMSYESIQASVSGQDFTYLNITGPVIQVPGHGITLKDALNYAASGDRIELAPGVYSGEGYCDLWLPAINLRIVGTEGAEKTVLDFSEHPGRRAFYARQNYSDPPFSVHLEGMTIRGASTSSSGGAVYCEGEGVHLTLKNLVLVDNSANSGGGVSISRADAYIRGCTFHGNAATGCNGAVSLWRPGAIDIDNTIVANSTGGGIGVTYGSADDVRVHCCNAHENDGGNYTGLLDDPTGLNGNISADPLFCDPDNGDLHLDALSPCLPANNDCGVRIGALGQGCSIDYITINGVVRDPSGIGVSGVSILGGPSECITDLDGGFSLFVEPGWSGTLTPMLASFSFTPAEHVLSDLQSDISNLDFTMECMIISGFVYDQQGQGCGSVDIAGGPVTATTASNGEYHVRVYPGWSGTLTPIASEPELFEPLNRQYQNLTVHVDSQDFTIRTIATQRRVPEVYATIEDALDYAVHGDSILLAPGTYSGTGFTNVDLSDVDISIIGTSGSDSTLIDLSESRGTRAFKVYFYSGQRNVLIQGIHVHGGQLDQYEGGAVSCQGYFVDLSLKEMVFTDCHAAKGGAVYVRNSSALMENCTLNGNSSHQDKGVIYIYSYDLIRILNCIVSNTTSGGGLFVDASHSDNVEIACSDFFNNTGGNFTGQIADQTGLNGNICVDPLYCNTGSHDLTLNQSSPCLPENNTCNVLIGALEQGCDESYFNITGIIRDPSGDPVVGLEFDNGQNTVISDVSGRYTFHVLEGWSGTVTPHHEFLTFTPSERTYVDVQTNWVDQDFTLDYRLISGTIRDSRGAACPGMEIEGAPMDIVTNDQGLFTAQVPVGWSGTLTPQHEIFSFTPPSRTYENLQTDMEEQDFTMEILYISGTILSSQGAPCGDIPIEGPPSEVVTDDEGRFEIPVPLGWSGTLTPQHDLYSFSPPELSYDDVQNDQEDQNFTMVVLTISGTVRDHLEEPAAGISISGGMDIAITDGEGQYTIFVPEGWSGTLIPAADPPELFNPANRMYSNLQTDLSAQDFTIITNGTLHLVPEMHATIIDALIYCDSGDTISIAPGTYSGVGFRNIDPGTRSISFLGRGEPDEVIIDLLGISHTNAFSVTEDPGDGPHNSSLFQNLTIKNGNSGKGGAIYLKYTSLAKIRNIVFIDNHATQYGGAVYAFDATPEIGNCTFIGNSCVIGGGAIYSDSNSPIVVENLIFAHSEGPYAIWSQSSGLEIHNCIFHGNLEGDGPAGQMGINGNVIMDPIFCDPDEGEFSPANLSYALPENNPSGELIGALEQGCELRECLISGTVTDDLGRPISGVEMRGGIVPVETSATGAFTVAVLERRSGTITPIKVHYNFTPTSYDFESIENDITGLAFTCTREFGGDPVVPDELADLQSAFDYAQSGDTIRLAEGIFAGDGNCGLDFCGRAISLIGQGPANSVIDLSDTPGRRAFVFDDGETRDAVLQGLTIRGGRAALPGVGIYCEGASPTLREIVITRNLTTSGERDDPFGAALTIVDGSPLIENCVIHGNTDDNGAAIRCADESAPEFTRTIISGNSGGILVESETAEPTFSHCLFHDNGAGDFLGNIADQIGMDGNLSADPLFCDADGGLFTVAYNSPCLPGRNDSGLLLGVFGTGCNFPAGGAPGASFLAQNHPNPFNPTTEIAFGLNEAANVSLDIFDVGGRAITTLVSGETFPAGYHTVTWNGRDSRGELVSSGVYFYRLRSRAFTETKRMLLIK